jgi:hypothetical protein
LLEKAVEKKHVLLVFQKSFSFFYFSKRYISPLFEILTRCLKSS